ncbi:MAG TPA: type VI secretion system-associated FHA domain protein TagH [Methylocella sp.]|nr:type VI secretion system-associated FHA domain protein TagH [Methylocella sp.]
MELAPVTLILTIENRQSLPNGVPVSVTLSNGRGLEIGRNENLDWTLPDPLRIVSGKHCEVRCRDGAYWLHDVSTNGTFLNDNPRRIQTPYRLRHGDRLLIGPYVIGVAIVEDENPLPGQRDGCRLLDPCELAPPGPSLQGIAPEANREALSKDPVGGGPNSILCKPVDAGDREVQALEFQSGSLPDRSASASIKETPVEPEAGRPASIQQANDGNGPSLEEFLRRFAAAAKIPEQCFGRRDPLTVAEELGGLMRVAVENLTQLLNARVQTKRFVRASSQTTIQALDNNPLKFAPTCDDALKIMFGPRTSGYLDARRAFESAFADLKSHQVDTFSAMQRAVHMLVEDLDPKAIEEAAGPETRLAALFGSRTSKPWNMYVARWQAKALRHENGLVDAFMLYFAECYDQLKDRD